MITEIQKPDRPVGSYCQLRLTRGNRFTICWVREEVARQHKPISIPLPYKQPGEAVVYNLSHGWQFTAHLPVDVRPRRHGRWDDARISTDDELRKGAHYAIC